MSKPYGLISDVHLHNWSAFSRADGDGTNNRLNIILGEMLRAAEAVKAAGGNTLRIAGDLFHVRGKIAPSVINPTIEVVKLVTSGGVKIEIIPGNHDLENNESDSLGNALRALREIEGVRVFDKSSIGDGDVIMVPWHSSVAALRVELERVKASTGGLFGKFDVIIHAPVNGVIMGIPDHGFTPDELAAFGFKRVLAGHYHNHKDFGNGVYSIGALTHQTWSDVGTKAGYMLVYPDRVDQIESEAPKFVDVDETVESDDLSTLVCGNYARVKITKGTEAEIRKIREALGEFGAKGVVVHAVRSAAITRTGSTVETGVSVEGSVGDFIKSGEFGDKKELSAFCMEILNEAREAADA